MNRNDLTQKMEYDIQFYICQKLEFFQFPAVTKAVFFHIDFSEVLPPKEIKVCTLERTLMVYFFVAVSYSVINFFGGGVGGG